MQSRLTWPSGGTRSATPPSSSPLLCCREHLTFVNTLVYFLGLRPCTVYPPPHRSSISTHSLSRTQTIVDIQTTSSRHSSYTHFFSMPRQGRRVYRLPQRLDYPLIPAPLNLSFPLANEKSPLPAIIVTPSSPTDSHFFIAFSPKPTFRERISTYIPFQSQFQLKARTAIFLSLLLFIVVCHLFTHQFTTHRPHLRFDNFEAGGSGDHITHTTSSFWDLFGFKHFWDTSISHGRRNFSIDEHLLI